MKYSFKSLLSIALVIVGGSLYFLDYIIAGLIIVAISPAPAMQETDKVTGPLQFAAFYLTAGATALFMALHTYKAGYAFPIAAMGLLLGASIAVLRMQFFGFITHTRFNALEVALTPIPLALFVLGNIYQPVGWEGWIMGAIFLPVQIYSNLGTSLRWPACEAHGERRLQSTTRRTRPGFYVEQPRRSRDFARRFQR